MKNVIKEIFIMLLLCIAIALVLAVVFYEYNPLNKEVPSAIKYQMPEKLGDVQNELNTTLTNSDEQIIRTYEVTEDDLDKYKNTNSYDAGKVNPFEAYSENTDNTTNTANTSNTTSNTTTNKTNTNSSGTFFNTAK